MLERIGIIFNKEILDNLRDRRTLGSALFGTLLGPMILLIMLVLIGQLINDSRNAEKPLNLPVAGAERAPNLIRFLEQANVIITEPPADPRTAVRNGEVEVVLIIPEDFAEEFIEGRPAPLEVVEDSSRQSASITVNRVRNLLSSYGRQLTTLRLVARGVSPALIRPLDIRGVDVATPQSQVLIFLNTLPYFLMFALFSGGAGVIIDSTAGERERGSLEPLLINPATRREIVLGKLLAALPFATGTVLLSLIAYAIMFNVIPLEEFLGLRLSVDVWALAGIFGVCLPMVLLAAALQMIIATFAKNFKEAQTYVGYLPLVPALPGLGLAFLPIKPDLWTMLIPTFGQQILINQFMRGEPISVLNVMVSALVTLALASVLIVVAIRLYEREQIILSR